ncbi:hypothetical protein C8Q78DRAFT_613417 [Trametes maxima]|nr:hypothetical protein C8Q78DRAFT_613417 [Trametes maxima]
MTVGYALIVRAPCVQHTCPYQLGDLCSPGEHKSQSSGLSAHRRLQRSHRIPGMAPNAPTAELVEERKSGARGSVWPPLAHAARRLVCCVPAPRRVQSLRAVYALLCV